jgi:hypothetical protein
MLGTIGGVWDGHRGVGTVGGVDARRRAVGGGRQRQMQGPMVLPRRSLPDGSASVAEEAPEAAGWWRRGSGDIVWGGSGGETVAALREKLGRMGRSDLHDGDLA